MAREWVEHVCMLGVELDTSALESSPRRSRAERLRVVEETLEPGASVARVARKYGVNANQVFQWGRLYCTGRLGPVATELKLLPVHLAEQEQHAPCDEPAAAPASAAIHIELPGRTVVSLEGPVDAALACAVLECLRRATTPVRQPSVSSASQHNPIRRGTSGLTP